jgi:hypothetical protein
VGRRTWIIALALAAASAPPLWSQSDPASSEHRLKAAFVYRFPQFVEWPANVLDQRATLDICVASPNPFGSTLEDLVAGETLNGRRLAVRQVDRRDTMDGCRVLYVPGDSAEAALARVADRPVLTVGESPRFLDEGGVILLRLVDRRVRFEVNAIAAERAGLRLSSQLLRLALSVRGVAE